MSFKYVNPGRLFLVPNRTNYNQNFLQQLNDVKYNANDGLAFAMRPYSSVVNKDAAQIPIDDGIYELWVNCDIWMTDDMPSEYDGIPNYFAFVVAVGTWINNHYVSMYFNVDNGNAGGLDPDGNPYSGTILRMSDGDIDKAFVSFGKAHFSGLHHYSWHIKLSTDATTESGMYLYMDGELICSYTGQMLSTGAPLNEAAAWVRVGGPRMPSIVDSSISNIIISDVALSPYETVKIIPVSAISGDWTANADGTYSADALNKSIMITPDAASLGTAIGTKNTINSVSHAAIDLSFGSAAVGLQSKYKLGSADAVSGDTLSLDVSQRAQVLTAALVNPVTSNAWHFAELGDMRIGFNTVED